MEMPEQGPASEPARGSAAKSAEKLAAELQRLRDEVLWQNHRAGSEVKDAVQVLATELERTADTLKACAPALDALRESAAVKAHLALLEATDKLALLEDLVRSALSGAARSPTFIGETARLKLALGRLEATDLFEDKRRALMEQRRRLAQSTDATLEELDERLADILGK